MSNFLLSTTYVSNYKEILAELEGINKQQNQTNTLSGPQYLQRITFSLLALNLLLESIIVLTFYTIRLNNCSLVLG